MSIFNKGDYVVRTGHSSSIVNQGEVYVIDSVATSGGLILKDMPGRHAPRLFELYEPDIISSLNTWDE